MTIFIQQKKPSLMDFLKLAPAVEFKPYLDCYLIEHLLCDIFLKLG